MGYFTEFLRQKTPASRRVMPAYYRKALTVTEAILAGYFLAAFFLFPALGKRWEWVPACFCVLTAFAMWRVGKMNIVTNFIVFSTIVLLWCGWGVYTCGWSIGVQHFLIVLILLLFFNICISPKIKVLLGILLLGYRIALYALSNLMKEPVHILTDDGGMIFQTTNSTVFFLLVAIICIILSSSIQDTERRLRLDNESLTVEAGTDPLTGLPNRREMIGMIRKFQKDFPDLPFSVAIADIDYFKHVNDTYGHACGDAALVTLTDLFRSSAEGQYRACRWGGEEFCFFLPKKNLDEAGMIMKDLSFAVEKMTIDFEGFQFNITITVGVEETDFRSTLEELLESADEKLYLGKKSGRNRVVV